jgi:hypothetical protein
MFEEQKVGLAAVVLTVLCHIALPLFIFALMQEVFSQVSAMRTSGFAE